MKRRLLILPLLIAVLVVGCKKESDHRAAAAGSSIAPLHTDGRWFKDAQNRVVILRGINVINSVKYDPHDYTMTEEDWDILHGWGINIVRLLIIWDAIEPERGVFDDTFFDKVDQQIRWAEERGIYVLLDMHQDLYGPAFGGDGAPPWASRTDIPFTYNEPWGINYFAPAIIASYDDFWASEDLQDHFTQAWLHAVRRFKDRPIVMGYDLYNEPFFGSRTPWNFERDYLGPLQNRVAASIRTIDPDRIIFYEPMIYTSGGIPTFLAPPALQGNIAFAPHYYDPTLGFVHASPYDGNPTRMEAMMDMRDRESVGLGNIPWLLGEFGIGGGTNSDQYLHDLYDALERHMASGTYWDYGKDGYMGPLNSDGSEKPRVNDMARPFPVAIAGEPLAFSFDMTTKVFTLKYQQRAGVTGPTEIYIPEARHYPGGFIVQSTDTYWQHDYDGSILRIYADPQMYTHTITVRPKP